MDTLLFDNTLFGKRFSSNCKEVYEFLNEKIKSAEPATELSKHDVLAIRLVKYANDKGWLENLAELLAKDAAEIEMIDGADTFSKVCSAFDKTMRKPDGLSLWSLSVNAHANLVIFTE